MKRILIEIDDIMNKKNWKHTIKSDYNIEHTINVLINSRRWIEESRDSRFRKNNRVKIVVNKKDI